MGLAFFKQDLPLPCNGIMVLHVSLWAREGWRETWPLLRLDPHAGSRVSINFVHLI